MTDVELEERVTDLEENDSSANGKVISTNHYIQSANNFTV